MERLVALHRDAIARAHLREVVPHRDMLHAAIVPERNGMRLPAEPHLPVWTAAMLVKEIQDRLALRLRHILDRVREYRVHEDRLSPAHRMRADHRMFGAWKRLRPLGASQAIGARVVHRAVMNRDEA